MVRDSTISDKLSDGNFPTEPPGAVSLSLFCQEGHRGPHFGSVLRDPEISAPSMPKQRSRVSGQFWSVLTASSGQGQRYTAV